MAIYRSEARGAARPKHYAVLTITCILLLQPQLPVMGRAQAAQPITKELLIRALKQGARNVRLRASAERYVELIKQIGVDFQITPAAERSIRRAGSYLGAAHLDELITAVRANYRAASPSFSLSSSVEKVEVTPHPDGGLQVFVRFSIRNNGPPSIAHAYSLNVRHATSRSIDFKEPAANLDKPFTVPPRGGSEEFTIQPEAARLNKLYRETGL
jgi:hypothetical protein